MLKVPHGVGIGRIRKQDVAVWRAAGHRAKIECHRIRAAAVHDVARVNDQAVLSHGDREIAPATERLADGAHALHQRLVFEQGYERDRRSVELIEATNGARSAEGWAPRLLGSLTHQSATEPRPNPQPLFKRRLRILMPLIGSPQTRRRQRWPPIRDGQALSIPRDTLVNVNSEAFAKCLGGSDGPAVRRCFNVTALYRKSGG